MSYKILIILNLLIFFNFLISCAPSPQSKFYKVSSINYQKKIVDYSKYDNKFAIAINTVEIPDYLNRPQIVAKREKNEVSILEFHRWAGSLRDNITLVLAENLSDLLLTNRVYTHPRIKVDDIDHVITITFFDIELIPNEKIFLKGSYVIRDLKQKRDVFNKVFVFSEDAKTEKISQLIEVFNLCLYKLSVEIAQDIKRLNNL